MSWIEKINQKYIITTGDGQQYTPLWDATAVSKQVDFNVAEFNFPGQEGTFVDRRLRKGSRYSMVIQFQGENHLDESARFEESAKDRRPWTVEHPLYGRILVQPISLNFDNSGLNSSRITGEIVETIDRGSPRVNTDPVDVIEELKTLALDAGALAFTLETPDPQSMQVDNQLLYSSAVNSGAPQQQAENYFNLFNEAQSAILNATAEPLAAIRALQAVIEAPAAFEIAVRNRFSIFLNQFNQLVQAVATITDQAGKIQFETNAGSLLCGMCSAASTPLPNDYLNATDVISIVGQLLSTQNTYIEVLDSLQTDNGGAPDSYIPGYDFISGVTTVVNQTSATLFDIATNAQQQRSIFCESDTNVILLAHRFYGLSDDDANIDRVINTNDIGLSEILGIVKGRKIVYYV